MNGYVYHFTGKVRRAKRIEATRWEKSPCDEIAERLSPGSRWAEVGVADGYNAIGVLSRIGGTMPILVDSWREASARYKDSGDLAAKLTSDQWERVYEKARRLMARHGGTLIRKKSAEAAAEIEDASLDLVYIDAEHTYEAVKEDIASWLPKVKAGGWIGGHDYDHPNESQKKLWGVKKAVDEVFGAPDDVGVCHTWFSRVKN
jgi:hypothetical protein